MKESKHMRATRAIVARQPRACSCRRAHKALILVGRHAVLVVVAALFCFPFVVMLSTSFKTPPEIFQLPPRLWPERWTLANYRQAVEAMPFVRYLLNTLFLSTANVVGALFSCPLVAYSLSKIQWGGRRPLFLLVLATMMLPPQVTMIPVYILWNRLGLMGTYWPLVLPSYLGSAFFIFMLRQFFMGIPNELLDAARIDGASDLRIYLQIVLPLARSALAVVAIFTFVWTWTDFLNPLIYLNDESMYTLSVGLYAFFSEHGVQWGPLMAACSLFSLPLVALFILAQRQFIEGISMTGLR